MSDQVREIVRVNKIALVFLTVIATTIGFTPASLALDQLDLLLFVIFSALISVILVLRSYETIATKKPSSLEFFLGGLGAIFMPSVTAFTLMGINVILLWGIKAVVSIGEWLGVAIQLNAELIATNGSIIFALFFGLLSGYINGKNLSEQLYPQTAGITSAFYAYSKVLINLEKRELIIEVIKVLIIPVGLLAILIWTSGTFASSWFNIAMNIFLMFISGKYAMETPVGMEVITKTSEITIDTLGGLFEAGGYTVFPYPRTGEEKIDPILIGVDFYIQDIDRAFVVNVLTTSSENEESILPSKLHTAAWALESYFQETEQVQRSISPLIVFVGYEPDDAFRKLIRGEGVQTIEYSDLTEIRNILRTDENERKFLARNLLGVYAASEDSGLHHDNTIATEGMNDG